MFLSPFVSVPRPRSAWADLDREFDRVFRGASRPSVPKGWEVKDAGEAWTFSAALPGFSVENLKVEATEQTLSLSGARELAAPEGFKAVRQERGTLEFSHSFQFPQPINPDAIEAKLDQGVLLVKVPKKAATTSRSIKIQA